MSGHEWLLLIIFCYASLNIGMYFGTLRSKAAFAPVWWAVPLGAFVVADVLLLSMFWMLVSIMLLAVNQVYVSMLVVSTFWCVRALGEIIYWFLVQFVDGEQKEPITRYVRLHKWFGDGVWVVWQLWWQLILVVCVVLMILAGKRI